MAEGTPDPGPGLHGRTFAPAAVFPEPERVQTPGEELANSLSHGVGAVAALVAFPWLLRHAARSSNMVGAGVFGATVLLLYLCSALYHALPRGRAKAVVRLIEHSAIFLLIAGTYTPFTLGVLAGPWGWRLFSLVWGLAAVGVSLKIIFGERYPTVCMVLYLGMGWALLPAVRLIPGACLLWLLLGGAAYTAGIAFYAAERLRFAHFIWHLFVLGGTTFHFFAVLWYAG